MIKISTPTDSTLIGSEHPEEMEDFLQQGEQEFLQLVEAELDQLLLEPSESIIKKILGYARLFN